MLVKCSWLVWRHVSSRPRDSSETFRIHRETRWGSRPKFRSQILDSWRKVPIVFREPLKHELDRLSNIGVIQKVDKPTSWIAALEVTTKKNGKAMHWPKTIEWSFTQKLLPLTYNRWCAAPVIKGPQTSRFSQTTERARQGGQWVCLGQRSSWPVSRSIEVGFNPGTSAQVLRPPKRRPYFSGTPLWVVLEPV